MCLHGCGGVCVHVCADACDHRTMACVCMAAAVYAFKGKKMQASVNGLEHKVKPPNAVRFTCQRTQTWISALMGTCFVIYVTPWLWL